MALLSCPIYLASIYVLFCQNIYLVSISVLFCRNIYFASYFCSVLLKYLSRQYFCSVKISISPIIFVLLKYLSHQYFCSVKISISPVISVLFCQNTMFFFALEHLDNAIPQSSYNGQNFSAAFINPCVLFKEINVKQSVPSEQ